MYCLWLNGKKVYTLRQLRDSFDAEAVGLYCLGGGLARWLKDCGEPDTAEKVEQIDLSENISRQLAEIFDVELPEKEEQAYESAASPQPTYTAGCSFTLPPSSLPDTSFFPGSFFTSFDTTSFNFSATYNSFFTTSFLTTSFGSYEYEYEYESGSFTTGSFSLYFSSFFSEFAFSTGSFASGSFIFGSFIPEWGSFPMMLSSFSPESLEMSPTAMPLTPQQKFELNLSSNPLNRYGYGIHLI